MIEDWLRKCIATAVLKWNGMTTICYTKLWNGFQYILNAIFLESVSQQRYEPKPIDKVPYLKYISLIFSKRIKASHSSCDNRKTNWKVNTKHFLFKINSLCWTLTANLGSEEWSNLRKYIILKSLTNRRWKCF